MSPIFSYHAVIFDLDGTLIDSAPGIFSSLQTALIKAEVPARVPLDESLIGPSLREMLMTITGITGDETLRFLISLFKDSYDNEGYKLSRPYDGVEEILKTLCLINIPISIATNKRRIPTLKILNHLGWDTLFSNVITLDSPPQPYASKEHMLASLLATFGVEGSSAVYIGDKSEDRYAAAATGMNFVAAGWGYGTWGNEATEQNLCIGKSPKDLLRIFRGSDVTG